MTFTIAATKREGEADATREAGNLPAVVYGPEIDTISLSVPYRDFEKLYTEAGESSLIDCAVEGQKDPITVLIQEVQYDPVKGSMLHVDFRQIKMGEEMSATIELRLVGEPGAVKTLGGTLIEGTSSVNVTCLPKNLVGHIDVDISTLETFEDSITVGDLDIPEGITVTDNLTTNVAKVIPPLTSEQLAAMEETTDASVDDVEVDGEKEEDADGEAKAEAPAEEKKAE